MSTNDWATARLGDVFSSRRDPGISGLPLLAVTMEGVVDRERFGRRVLSELSPEQHIRVRAGDLAYNTMRMWQAVCGIAPRDGLVSPAYVVCRPVSALDPGFCGHLMKHHPMVRWFARYSQGLTSDRHRLYFNHFAQIPIRYPPLAEQRRIAEILDTADEAVRKTEEVIAKLQQMKQGLLHDLLTRGIDENGELRDPERHPEQFKDSPLGLTPHSWEIRRFGDALRTSPQNGLYKPASAYGPSGTPIVRIDGFYDGVIAGTGELKRLQTSRHETDLYGLAAGDILINRVNSIDYVGKSALVSSIPEPVVFESNIMRCRLDIDRLHPDFAILWLLSPRAARWLRRRAKSAIAQASINQGDVTAMWTPLPPVAEQIQIAEKAKSLDALLTSDSGTLDKLRLMKQGLMNDLLTGRVRVPTEATAP